MSLTLVDLAKDTAKVTIEVQGNPLTIEYYPTRVTEKAVAALQIFGSLNAGNLAEGFKGLNETLATLIKSWDFYEDVDKAVMVPLTPERLADVPLFLRVQVLNAILGDLRPEALVPQTLA